MTQDRKVALFDLGMVGHISEGLRNDLLPLLIALSEGRADETAEVAQRIGTPTPEFRREELEKGLTDLVQAQAGASVEEIQLGSTVMKVTDLCGRCGLSIPHEMYMLGKMLLNLDMVGRALDPNFRPDEAIRRHSAAMAKSRMREELSPGNLLSFAQEAKELFAQTPSRLNRVLENVANNKVKIEVDAIDETSLLKGFEKIANRITVGVILGALIIGAAMMMHIETGFTVLGYPGIAMLFFLLASAGALLLAWRILFARAENENLSLR